MPHFQPAQQLIIDCEQSCLELMIWGGVGSGWRTSSISGPAPELGNQLARAACAGLAFSAAARRPMLTPAARCCGRGRYTGPGDAHLPRVLGFGFWVLCNLHTSPGCFTCVTIASHLGILSHTCDIVGGAELWITCQLDTLQKKTCLVAVVAYWVQHQ